MPVLFPATGGGSPLNWQIINGETSAGVSVLRVGEGIDAGAVLAEGAFPIGPDDTIADVHAHANQLFPTLVLDVLAGLDGGTLVERPQDPAEARYWHQRNEADGRIHWARLAASQVHDLVRAVAHPYPGAFTFLEGRKLRIFSTKHILETISGVPGRVSFIQELGPLVTCMNRAILLDQWEWADGGKGDLRHGVHFE